MIIGIPKEIKNNENRVALTPAGARELVKRGHKVYVQATAGVNSGFADDAYTAVGAEMLPSIEEVYARAEMIVKVKEPVAPEYKLIRRDQLVFTFFHFASSEPLTRAMVDSGAVCCAYETVELADRSLPLLIPMSEVAGRMAAQEGRYFLEKPRGGKGVLLGGVPGVKPAKVFVIGAGVVGTAAARTAAGTGADVTICDISLQRLTYLADVMPRNVKTLMSSEYNIREELKHADLVVGSVLIPGAKAPKLVTRDMLREMEPGTVMVDVAIDQGGCFETSRPTTHEDPVYYVDGILHYCVANIPGAVPRTSTLALTNATLPYTIQLADKGWRRAAQENPELALGLNIIVGGVHAVVDDLMAHRLHDLAQRGFDQCVLRSLAILIDQSDFHNFFSLYRCISADKLTEIRGIDALVVLGHLGNAAVQRVGHIVKAAPVGSLRLDLLLEPGGHIGVGAGALDEVGARAGGLSLRLVAIGAAKHRHNELALAVAPAHDEPDAHWLYLNLGGLLTQDLDDLFQRQVLGLVLVHGIDDLYGGQRIARKADHHIAVDLADLGQVVFDDMGCIAGDRLLDKAAITDHSAEAVTAHC